ncbi:MAG TPA: response regulator [Brevibacillus sp.]|nr:response regulator [Brevibacillus sp.]
MKAILVDDERLALSHLKQILEKYATDIECIGEFSDPTVVLEQIKELQPDVVFLDIQMPEIDGLQLGEQVQAAFPHILMVFVTAFDRFALQAFDLYALDYLLKPVLPERLQQSVQRLREKMESRQDRQIVSRETKICCFQQIRIQLPGKEPESLRWGSAKALELFAYLLHHRNQVIDNQHLIELLWPDYEESRAAQQLFTAIYHIRQTLQSNGMGTVTIRSGECGRGYMLTLGEAQVDTEKWEGLVKQAEQHFPEQVEACEHAFSMYEGDYLGAYDFMWAEQERERLRNLWLSLAEKLIDYYSEKGMLQEVSEVRLRVQQLLSGQAD